MINFSFLVHLATYRQVAHFTHIATFWCYSQKKCPNFIALLNASHIPQKLMRQDHDKPTTVFFLTDEAMMILNAFGSSNVPSDQFRFNHQVDCNFARNACLQLAEIGTLISGTELVLQTQDGNPLVSKFRNGQMGFDSYFQSLEYVILSPLPPLNKNLKTPYKHE